MGVLEPGALRFRGPCDALQPIGKSVTGRGWPSGFDTSSPAIIKPNIPRRPWGRVALHFHGRLGLRCSHAVE